MGTGFLMGVNIFHGYGFGIAKPDGFVPVAISIYDTLFSLLTMMMVLVALKGTRAVSRVPLRKDLFVG